MHAVSSGVNPIGGPGRPNTNRLRVTRHLAGRSVRAYASAEAMLEAYFVAP
ncbi:hypothetical protein [Paenibacillus dendritiformis]|uniref:hypothetical protein n=1 Tax=Paenibacillus dendritiformis TaxID=130049 RepID=UPI001BCBA276|nr:hypothetical protein [Paenibacillus dendritiformis]